MSEPDTTAAPADASPAPPAPPAPSASPPSKRWTRFYWLFAVVGGVVFALSWGLQFATSNQTTYMVHALSYLDPTLLPRDWYVRQAADLHNVFSHCVALVFRLDSAPTILAWTEIVLTTLACVAAASLARSLAGDDRDAAVVYAAWLVFAFVFRTKDVMSCFMFGGYLQPSSIGQLGLIWAMALFSRGRHFASGAALGLLGIFHLNYLALGVILFSGALLVLGFVDDTGLRSKAFVRRCVLQLVVPFFACLWALPKFLAAAGASSPEALHIVADIRAGHHYLPTFQKLLPSLAWQAAALVVFLGHVRSRAWTTAAARLPTELRNFLVLVLVFGGFIVVAAPLTTALHINTIIMLLPSRVAPHATMLAQMLLVGCALLDLRHGAGPRQWISLVVAAVVAVVWGTGVDNAQWMALLAGVVVVAALAKRFVPQAAAVVAVVAALVVLGIVAVPSLQKFTPTIGLGNPKGERLFTWARTKTDKGALFAVPPGLIEFRLMGRRSIVVDWKSVGVNAGDVLEWYRRMNLIAGTRNLRSRRQAAGGYERMDAARVRQLRDELGIDYVVMPRESAKTPLGKIVFQDKRWVVFDVAAAGAD